MWQVQAFQGLDTGNEKGAKKEGERGWDNKSLERVLISFAVNDQPGGCKESDHSALLAPSQNWSCGDMDAREKENERESVLGCRGFYLLHLGMSMKCHPYADTSCSTGEK